MVNFLKVKIEELEKRIRILEAAQFGKRTEPLLPEPIEPKKQKKDTTVDRLKKAIETNRELLTSCSHEELVQILWKLGKPEASKQVREADAIDIIKSIALHRDIFSSPEDFIERDIEDPVEEIRKKTFAYINKEQVDVSNMSCSLHCPTCPHYTVVECWTDNSDLIRKKDD